MSISVSPPINITVELDGGGEKWVWMIDSGYDGQPLLITSRTIDDVREASDKMTEALALFSKVVEGGWAGLSPDAKTGHLDSLKAKGRLLTGALFNGRQEEFTEHLARLTSPIITQFSRSSSHQPLFEFCLLNDGTTDFFLGERCICRYKVVEPRKPATSRAQYRAIQRTGTRLVGYAEDNLLGSSCRSHDTPDPSRSSEQIAIMMGLIGPGEKPFVLNSLSESLPDHELDVLRNWIAAKYHVVHFNCGADHSDRPTLRLRAGAKVGVKEMTHPAADFHDGLVFLNACSSAIGTNSLTTSIAEFFRQRRASCILCTTGPIEDGFATKLSRIFYDHLKEGMNVVSALLSARATLLQEEGHPMALNYTYIGNDDYRLV